MDRVKRPRDMISSALDQGVAPGASTPASTVDRNPSGDPIASIKCGTIIGPVTAIVAAIAIRIGWVGIAVGIGWVPIAVGIGGIAVARKLPLTYSLVSEKDFRWWRSFPPVSTSSRCDRT
jgi:hypothetical protein